jgi:hypothetical protein
LFRLQPHRHETPLRLDFAAHSYDMLRRPKAMSRDEKRAREARSPRTSVARGGSPDPVIDVASDRRRCTAATAR